MELDQLELISAATTAPPKKRTKAQQKADEEYSRSMGLRDTMLRMDLKSVCRNFTLAEIFHTWHEVRAAEAVLSKLQEK